MGEILEEPERTLKLSDVAKFRKAENQFRSRENHQDALKKPFLICAGSLKVEEVRYRNGSGDRRLDQVQLNFTGFQKTFFDAWVQKTLLL
jgi:hypothetical protein